MSPQPEADFVEPQDDPEWSFKKTRAAKEALSLILDIASSSTTPNSLPHIAKIAKSILEMRE